jgi:hypothetical protein
MNYKNRKIIDEVQEWNRIICLYYDDIKNKEIWKTCYQQSKTAPLVRQKT